MKNPSIRRDFADTDFEDAKSLVIWNALVEPGDRIAGELIRSLGASSALEAFLERRDLGESVQKAFERWAPRYRNDLFEEKLQLAQKHDLKLLLPSDREWHSDFNNLGAHSPLLIWYRGNLDHFNRLDRKVGVVGSRNATHYGQRITSELTSVLVEENAAVISGGALGIDSVAHRTALGLKGLTLAFMAGSLDCLYPAANYELFDSIGHKGLLLSELAPGSRPTRWRFLQRNRLIAALSDATIVTEAGWRSGSINTVNHACELSRPVFAVPGPITSPASAGCNRLIRDGLANLLLDVSDLPSELGWKDLTIFDETSLGSLEVRALDALTRKLQSADKILVESGLSIDELRIALGSLKLIGLAECGADGLWKRSETR